MKTNFLIFIWAGFLISMLTASISAYAKSPAPYTSTNLALNQATTQSSTYGADVSGKAVDGDSKGDHSLGSVTHTKKNLHAWWEVDLGDVKQIDEINIYNRTDCCSKRLKNFYIFISDTPFNSTDPTVLNNQSEIISIYQGSKAQNPSVFSVNGTGRYVRVQLAGKNFLSLAEVEVMGSSISIPGSGQDCNTCGHKVVTLSNENYISTESMRVPAQTDADVDLLSTGGEKTVAVQYLDGLGRPVQNIGVQAAPGCADIIEPIIYDEFGRVETAYLPFNDNGGVSGGFLRSNPLSSQQSFYHSLYPGEHAFAETVYEPSPLNRVIEQGAPGNSWQVEASSPGTQGSGEHTAITEYLINDTDILAFQTGEGLGDSPSNYSAGELSIVRSIDENGAISEAFTDKLGRTLFNKVEESSGVFAETHYIYDAFGRVAFVLQPEGWKEVFNSGSQELTASILDNWVFQYLYDERGRVIEKKVPGADWIHLVYDKLDRPIMTQDGNQRQNNDWLFTKFDVLGRPVLTGIYHYTPSPTDPDPSIVPSRIPLQLAADGHGILYEVSTSSDYANLHGYTNQAFPVLSIGSGEPDPSSSPYHSVSYYDDHNFDRDGSGTADFAYVPEPDIPQQAYTRLRGNLTGVKTRVLNPDPGMLHWLTTATFYNRYGQEIQTQSEHLHGVDISTNAVNFAGDVTKTILDHHGPSNPVSVVKTFCYDHQGRLLRINQQTDSDPEFVLAAYSYDALGRQQEKNLHSDDGQASYLQSIDYQYNIRNWMTGINQLSSNCNSPQTGDDNPDLFGMELLYDAPLSAFGGLHNGNISAIRWQYASSCTQHMYSFLYDKMSRLSQSWYASNDDGTWSANEHDFNTFYTYDLNGNIKTLNRFDEGDHIDGLWYTYSANRLKEVQDNAYHAAGFQDGANLDTEYFYDPNGNIIEDKNKGIAVSYNHLNKPTDVTFTNGNSLHWIYDAAGTKLQQQTVPSSGVTETTDYINGFYYTDQALQYFAHEEGRMLVLNSGDYRAEYNLTDHLGNVRVSFADVDEDGTIDPTVDVLQEDHYYPFGLQIASLSSVNGVANRFRYNGKELHEELGLGWYDYGFRWYMPDVARFPSVDPLAEDYTYYTPYQYAGNKPVWATDLDGLEEDITTDDGDERTFSSIITVEFKYTVREESRVLIRTTPIKMEASFKVTFENSKDGQAPKISHVTALSPDNKRSGEFMLNSDISFNSASDGNGGTIEISVGVTGAGNTESLNNGNVAVPESGISFTPNGSSSKSNVGGQAGINLVYDVRYDNKNGETFVRENRTKEINKLSGIQYRQNTTKKFLGMSIGSKTVSPITVSRTKVIGVF